MSELTELIHVNFDGEKPAVSGRELHDVLGVKTRYDTWFSRMCEYGFAENTDFVAIAQKRATAQGNKTTFVDHALTLDMAKEICMIQRTTEGKLFRQYFIEIEKRWNSPEVIMARALKMANTKLEQAIEYSKRLETAVQGQKAYIAEIEPKAQYCDEVLNSPYLCTVTEIAKDYGLTAMDLNRILYDNGVQFKVNGKWVLHQSFASKGYAMSKTYLSYTKTGKTIVSTHLCWTGKGRLFIHELLELCDIHPVAEGSENNVSNV